MAADEPWPISSMAMTAATPMTMPSVVSADRMTLRRSARRAVFMVRTTAIMVGSSVVNRRRRCWSPGFSRCAPAKAGTPTPPPRSYNALLLSAAEHLRGEWAAARIVVARLGGADDDLHARLELVAGDLGLSAVGQADAHGDRPNQGAILHP